MPPSTCSGAVLTTGCSIIDIAVTHTCAEAWPYVVPDQQQHCCCAAPRVPHTAESFLHAPSGHLQSEARSRESRNRAAAAATARANQAQHCMRTIMIAGAELQALHCTKCWQRTESLLCCCALHATRCYAPGSAHSPSPNEPCLHRRTETSTISNLAVWLTALL